MLKGAVARATRLYVEPVKILGQKTRSGPHPPLPWPDPETGILIMQLILGLWENLIRSPNTQKVQRFEHSIFIFSKSLYLRNVVKTIIS
jgi:hypothetical protein